MDDYLHVGERDLRRLAHSHALGIQELSAIGIRLLSDTLVRPGYGFLQSKPHDGLLLVSFEGSVHLQHRNERWHLPAGQAGWCPPGQWRELRVLGNDWHGMLMFCDPGGIMRGAGEQRWSLECPQPDCLHALLSGILAETVEGAARRCLPGLSAALIAWVHLLLERRGEPDHARSLRQLESAIQAQPGRDWSQRHMAGLLGISIATLRRWVEEVHGTNPRNWILELRMQLACAMLRGSHDPLKSIAKHLGYSQPFSFSAAFKRHLGQSPAHYRAEHQAPL